MTNSKEGHLSLSEWLEIYKDESNDVRGKEFERLTKRYFSTQPNVKNVWLWEEYPHRQGIDMGIDVIVKTKDGELWAIQCKNYTNTITWGDIATFVGASSKGYVRRILVTSRDNLSRNVPRQLDQHGIEYFGPAMFDGFDCREAASNKPAKIELYDYQREAVKAARKAIRKGVHSTLVMPTGAGKTVTFSRIAGKKKVMFAVPSIFLASQSARAFLADDPSRKAIIVCSDSTTGSADEKWAGVPVCKTVEEINKYPKHSVFVTYDSLDKVAESNHAFEIIFGDEAHRMAKAGPKGTAIWDLNTPIVWGTATPKTLRASLRDMGANVPSMDDVNLFGEEVYNISIRSLIEKGRLSDYRIVIMAVDDEEVEKFIADRGYVDNGGRLMNAEDAAYYIAMEKMRDEYGIKRVISYHQRVAQAEECAKRLRSLGFASEHIEGKTPDNERRRILGRLREEGVITNAKTLQEGIDIPTLDAVCFASPKRSQIDIVQSVGRALRLDPANPDKVGYIVLPVVINKDADGQVELENSNFSHIFAVLRYMADVDDAVRAEIEEIRTGDGANPRIVANVPARIIVSTNVAGMTKDELSKEINLHIVHHGVREDVFTKATRCVTDYARLGGALYYQSEFATKWGAWLSSMRQWYLENSGAGRVTKMPDDVANILLSGIPGWVVDRSGQDVIDYCERTGMRPDYGTSLHKKMQAAKDRGAAWAIEITDKYPTPTTFRTLQKLKEVNDFYVENGYPPSQKGSHASLGSMLNNVRTGRSAKEVIEHAKNNYPWMLELSGDDIRKAAAQKQAHDKRTAAIEKYLNLTERLGREPNDSEMDKGTANIWRVAYRDGVLSDEHIAMLESIPHWKWESTNQRLDGIQRYIRRAAEMGRLPADQSASRSIWKKAYREGRLGQQYIDLLESCEYWTWD